MGPYFGILIMNWNDFEPQSVVLDFVVLGLAADPYYTCQVIDMWTGNLIGNFKRYYVAADVPSHDCAALKIKCLPWAKKQSLESQLEYDQRINTDSLAPGFLKTK